MTNFFMLITLIAISCTPEISHPDLEIDKSVAWIDSSQTYAYIDSAWWEEFNDPMLDSVIAVAFRNNYNLKIAAAGLEAAQAQKTIAGADMYPALSIAGSASRREQSLITFPANIRKSILNPANNYGVTANVSWELDLWGRVRNAYSAGAANYQASQAEFDGVKLSLAAQTIKAWFSAIEATKQLELANANYKNYQLSQDRIFARYEKGIRPSLDFRMSKTSVATTEFQMYQRKQIAEQSIRQVEIILGKYPAGKHILSLDMPQSISEIPAGIPADILNQRPDIIAAERRLAASKCNVSAAKAALFPRISLTGSYGTSTNDIAEVLNTDFTVWSIVGNIVQPIFQGGKLDRKSVV